MISREGYLHQQVCDFMRYKYPDVIFRTDFAAGIKLTMGQARRHKRLQGGRAYPDLFIAYPAGPYHGLFLELKPEGTKLFKIRTPNEYATPHIAEQAKILRKLLKHGYRAEFAVGFEQARILIEGYMAGI